MKPWYKSKTIILNILVTLAPLIDYLASSVGLTQGLMTPARFAVYSMVVGGLNVALRAITTQGVSFFKEDNAQ
jgi:hypothetical protein